MSMKLMVGLPSPLRRHEYPGLWEDFFQRLGVDVVFSPPTNKAIFDAGVKLCTGDACLPLKVLHGHVLSLGSRADAVFVPRFVYPAPLEAACPKFCALPDILRLNVPEVTVWDMTVDLNKGLVYTLSTLDEMGRFMEHATGERWAGGASAGRVRAAFVEALTRPQAPWYYRIMSECAGEGSGGCGGYEGGPGAIDWDQANLSGLTGLTEPAVGVIGHGYLTQDAFVTMNLQAKIAGRGYRVITGDDVPYDLKRHCCYPFQNRAFWGVGVDLLGTALTLLNHEDVKGLIYVTSFACGIDSVVLELLERQESYGKEKPCMRLCLDEHTGESGFDTRLEAFFDLL